MVEIVDFVSGKQLLVVEMTFLPKVGEMVVVDYTHYKVTNVVHITDKGSPAEARLLVIDRW